MAACLPVIDIKLLSSTNIRVCFSKMTRECKLCLLEINKRANIRALENLTILHRQGLANFYIPIMFENWAFFS